MTLSEAVAKLLTRPGVTADGAWPGQGRSTENDWIRAGLRTLRDRAEALLVDVVSGKRRLEFSYAELRSLLGAVEQASRLGTVLYRLLLRPELERLRGGDTSVRLELVERLQDAAYQYPLATQKLVSALVAEGRRFAETPAGADLQSRLLRSAVINEAAAVLDIALPAEPEAHDGLLPSAYVDLLFQALSRGDSE